MYQRLLILVTATAICACQPPNDAAAPPGVTFLHLNDTYRIDSVEEGRRGGFGRVATLVRELQAEGRDVRILHGGDFLYPSLESQLWGGEQMVEALNFLDALAPVYVVPGNHEFDPRSVEAFIPRMRESQFDWVVDNMTLESGAADVDARMQSAITIGVNGGTVGIFGLTLHPDDGGNDRDFTPFRSGYLEIASSAIGKLEREGADLIIGLTHLNLADDVMLAALKTNHPTFQFIVGGHEHEPEYEQGTDTHATVMKGASNARTIWRIDVSFTADGPQVKEQMIAIDETIAIDTEYAVISDRWRARLLELMPFLESRIGEAVVPLDGREVTVRNEESNWGTFIADQMRTAFRSPAADLAFLNSGTLRIDDFVAEDITFEDIGRTFGFSSFLRRMTIRGADFRALLEAGYRGVGPSKGYFPQFSGFRVCVDRSQPDGQRIVQLLVPGDDGDWQAIDDNREYTLVAPDYIYRGGDGYDFSNARDATPPGSELKYLVLDAVIRAQAAGEKVGAEVRADSLRYAELQAGQERCFQD